MDLNINSMKESKQWVNWQIEKDKNGRDTKIPKNPYTCGNAMSNNPSTWGTFDQATKNKNLGIGFMFDNGVCGIDLDNHNDDDTFEERSQEIIKMMDTYTERSPSGSGYHIIFRCDISRIPTVLKDGKLKLNPLYYMKNPHNGVECYFSKLTYRFFTYTGDVVNNTEIADRTDQVIQFMELHMKKEKKETETPIEKFEDKLKSDILMIARNAKNGSKFIKLYDRGDTSLYNNDISVADQALCNMLAFYTGGNYSEIDNYFRKSALRREKWNRADYRDATINKAVEACRGEFYVKGKGKIGSSKSKKNDESNVFDQTDMITIKCIEQYLAQKNIDIKYNVITRQTLITGVDKIYSEEHLGDVFTTLVYDDLKFIFERCCKSDIVDAIQVITSKNRYNPVIDMLEKNTWDGVDRLPEVFKILNMESTDFLSKTLLHKWFWQCLSMAKNELKGAYGADGLLVLCGPQGLGKTSFARKMAVNQELCLIGKSLDFRDKDTLRRCGSAWIIELGEIETTFKSDKEKLKAFITDEIDQYRLPYGRCDTRVARRSSCIGTCNSTQYLIDETGNRRFWTVPIKNIDLDKLDKLDALQVWLQIESETKHNPQGFRLTKDEQAQLSLRNGTHEKPLKAECEILDIFTMAMNCESGLKYKNITVTEFKMGHNCLKNYSVQQISQALNKIGVLPQAPTRNGGKIEKLRSLPIW